MYQILYKKSYEVEWELVGTAKDSLDARGFALLRPPGGEIKAVRDDHVYVVYATGTGEMLYPGPNI